MLRALLLDFDGLLYDTETAAYESWRELYAAHGAPFPLTLWTTEVMGRPPGTHGFDPARHLSELASEPLDPDELVARRNARAMQMLPVRLMPGADALLAGARERGVATAIVTSNTAGRIAGHLERAGCAHRFDALICADGDPARGKPSPTLFEEALEVLGVAAADALAFEDSGNGVSAATGAGVPTIAVPNWLTRDDPGLQRADRVLDSLEQFRFDAA